MSTKRVGVFLDRDGTLNDEKDFLRTPDELKLIPGVARAVRMLNERGIPTCVISNQSGVARGFLTEETLSRINTKLYEELSKDGAHVDRLYYCPHHPTEGVSPYNIECGCRKPKPGMLYRGASELELELHRSFVIGDSIVDMQAGNAVGARTVLVKTGYGNKTREQCHLSGISIGHIAETAVDAIEFVLTELDGSGER